MALPTSPAAPRVSRTAPSAQLTPRWHVAVSVPRRVPLCVSDQWVLFSGPGPLLVSRATARGTMVIHVWPPGTPEVLHEAFVGLVADGRTTPRAAPKDPLQLGAIL